MTCARAAARSEVMGVGLALMALAFSHPMGAAFAFAAVPFLAFAVRPVLVASSAFNVVIALTLSDAFSRSRPSAMCRGSFRAMAGASSRLRPKACRCGLRPWRRCSATALARCLTLDASLAMAAALASRGADRRGRCSRWSYRRRPLVIPAVVFAASAIAATAISVLSGFFGDPAAIVVAAPVLAAAVVIRVPIARERLGLAIALLMLGWLGGLVSLALVDPITVNYLHAVCRARRQRAARRARAPAAPPSDATACWPTSTTLPPSCWDAAARAEFSVRRASRSRSRCCSPASTRRSSRCRIRRARPGRTIAQQSISVVVPRGRSGLSRHIPK